MKSSQQPDILTFPGGGVLGLALIGVYAAIKEANLTQGLKIVAGSSIGALMALSVAINYDPLLLLTKVLDRDIDIRKFNDSVFPSITTELEAKHSSLHLVGRLEGYYKPALFLCKMFKGCVDAYKQKGICKGEYIEKVVKDYISEVIDSKCKRQLIDKINKTLESADHRKILLEDKQEYHKSCTDDAIVFSLTQLKEMVLGKKSLTLEGLHQLRILDKNLQFKDLYITATNVSVKPRARREVFSYRTMPDLSIEKAIHCSMAAPPVFAPVEVDGKLYTDGGILCNSPFEVFKATEHTKNMSILGVDFGFPPEAMQEDKKPLSFYKFFSRVMLTPFDWQTSNRLLEDHKKIIYLNDLNTYPFNFDLSLEGQSKLAMKGYEQAKKYLAENKLVSLEKKVKMS